MKTSYRIREVQLRNVRSHVDTTVDFSDGINLIEGDVGSGKSTILQSIEAALLGYRVKELVRIGAQSAGVRLVLEPELIIELEVTPRGSKGGWLTREGKRVPLTASQLRESVVRVLSLGEASSTASEPHVFRTAVYVRQEDLKSILDNEEDIGSLVRKATGIERYSVARENSDSIGRELQNYLKNLRFQEEDLSKRIDSNSGVESELKEAESRLEQLSKDIADLERSLQQTNSRLEQLNREHVAKASAISGIRASLESCSKQEARLKKFMEELSSTILKLEEKRLGFDQAELSEAQGVDPTQLEEAIARSERELGRLKAQAETDEANRAELGDLYREIKELEREVESNDSPDKILQEYEEVNKRLSELTGKLGELRKQAKQFAMLLEQGLCPTCKRPVDRKELTEHVGLHQAEIKETEAEADAQKARLKVLEAQRKVAETIKQKRERLTFLRERARDVRSRILNEPVGDRIETLESELRNFKRVRSIVLKASEFERIDSDLNEKRRQLDEAASELDGVSADKRALESELKDKMVLLRETEEYLSNLKRETSQLQSRYNDSVGKMGELQKTVGDLKRRFEDYVADVTRLNDLKPLIDTTSSLVKYFREMLPKALAQLESDKLSAVQRDIRIKTKEYFGLLMQDEDRGVELKDFAPCMTRRVNGQWQTISQPSGGERSSLALAYRLALSYVARRYQGIGVGFIILDEPTDGFSEEQLKNFRSTLDRVEAEQLIIVTHHTALESLGGGVIKVTYAQDGSRVERVD